MFENINIIDSVTGVISVVFSGFRVWDLLDIALIAFAVYELMYFIKKTRMEHVIKGLLILIAAMLLSDYFNLYTVHFVLYNGLAYGLIAIIVIFHPELRRLLESIGRTNNLFKDLFVSKNDLDKSAKKEMIHRICIAVDDMSKKHTGALIVIEQRTELDNLLNGRGTVINAEVNDLLLENIFYEGSPLHDGAVILREDKIYMAGAVLPVSKSEKMEKTLGTRHRAALGISEVSDAMVIIVSEETGIVSIALKGKLSRYLDIKTVEKTLLDIYITSRENSKTESNSLFANVFRKDSDE